MPLSEPESKAMAALTERFDPALTLSLHSQGEVIYWEFQGYAPENAQKIGELLAELTGYALADTPYAAGFAGYKDWFLQDFRRPGYTIEVGRGVNPLPISDLPGIYEKMRAALAVAALVT